MSTSSFTRDEIEDFLYEEAALLDDWKLDEWLALYTETARYLVPATDLPKGAEPEGNLFYIADDRFRIGERVKRLQKKTAFSEYPRSKTRHLVSNVRILAQDGDECRVQSAFVTFRSKGGQTDTYMGSTDHTVVRTAAGRRRWRCGARCRWRWWTAASASTRWRRAPSPPNWRAPRC
jgi:p-cumate 2,3-dioxygenase beta subunit